MFIKIESIDKNHRPEYFNVDTIQSFREYVPKQAGAASDDLASKGVKSVIFFKKTPLNPNPSAMYTSTDIDDILIQVGQLKEY